MEKSDDFKYIVNQIQKYDRKFVLERQKLMKMKDHKSNNGRIDKLKEMFEISKKVYDYRIRGKELLLESNNILKINEDDRIIDAMKQIRDDKKNLSIIFYDEVMGRKSYYFEEMDESLKDKFFEQFSSIEYAINKIELKPIIVADKYSGFLEEYFEEIIRAYSFDMDIALIALCRAVLEISITDKLESNKNYQKDIKDRRIDKCSILAELINRALKYKVLNNEMTELTKSLKNYANDALHISAADQNSRKKKKANYKIIKDIINVVEYLYN